MGISDKLMYGPQKVTVIGNTNIPNRIDVPVKVTKELIEKEIRKTGIYVMKNRGNRNFFIAVPSRSQAATNEEVQALHKKYRDGRQRRYSEAELARQVMHKITEEEKETMRKKLKKDVTDSELIEVFGTADFSRKNLEENYNQLEAQKFKELKEANGCRGNNYQSLEDQGLFHCLNPKKDENHKKRTKAILNNTYKSR